MTLNDAIGTDANTVFTRTDDFAESVTYIPHQYYGESTPTNRSIRAVVIRESETVVGEDGGEAVVPVFEVHVQNSSTLGIAGTELDLGGDRISFPPRDGESAVSKAITRLVVQDHGMLVLECR